MESKINLKNRALWLLIIGLFLIGLPSLIDKIININVNITDFSIGLGAALVLASLYFFSRRKINALK